MGSQVVGSVGVGDPSMDAGEAFCDEADRFLAEHGIVDVDGDVQPVDDDSLMRIMRQRAFENAIYCVGLIGTVVAAQQIGRVVFRV